MFGPILFFWFWLGASAYMEKDQIYNLELKIKKNCTKISVSYQNPSWSMKRNMSPVFLNLLTKISVSVHARHLMEVPEF